MVNNNLSWKFPNKEFLLLKIETVFIAILSLFIFIIAWSNYGLLWAIIAILIFLILYLIISYLVQRYRKIEEHYSLTATHLHIKRKTKNKIKKVKIAWNNIKHHRLDKFFHGGYVLTHDKKKHPLFFNSRKEVETFEKSVKRYLNPKKKSKKR
jgi:hypothetical protein